MLPSDARCDQNYVCPPVDNVDNPIISPDWDDCRKYFICFNGTPLPRFCAEDFWWDARKGWCTTADEVECDERTTINPDNPVPPTEPPIISHCYRTSHLFNPDNGSYMKSACVSNSIFNYEESEQECLDNNMHLFVINNANVQTTFHEAMERELASYTPIGRVWINGRRDASNGEWFSYNPNRALVFAGLEWVQTESIDGRTSGDCLRYSQVHGGRYQGFGEACVTSAPSYLACEFFQPPQLSTDICSHESSLIDQGGNYLKTACFVDQMQTQYDAQQTCLDNGMTLFVINNATVQSALIRSTSEGSPGASTWINGKKDSQNEEWFAYEPKKVSLSSDIDWVEDGETFGDCLQLTAQSGDIKATAADCQEPSWFVCEH